MSEAETNQQEVAPENGAPEETIETKPEYKCKYCGGTTFSDGRKFREWADVGIHVRTECPNYERKPRKGAAPPSASSPGPVTHERRLPVRPAGETASAPTDKEPSDEKELLEGFLDEFTDLTENQRKIVRQWTRLQGFIHPTMLVGILVDECGVKTTKANMIANKYAMALTKFQTERSQRPAIMPYMGPYTQQQPGVMPWMNTQWNPGQQQFNQNWPQQPQQPYPQQPDNRSLVDEFRRMMDENREKSDRRFEKMEEKITQLTQGATQTEYVEEAEPVIFNGKVVTDEGGQPVYKQIRRPASAATKGENVNEIWKFVIATTNGMNKAEPLNESKVLELIERVVAKSKEPLTEEKIRSIVKEIAENKPLTIQDVEGAVTRIMTAANAAQPKEDPRLTEVSSQLKDAQKSLEDMARKFNEQEKKALEDKIGTLNTQLENLRSDIRNMPSGEFKSDELKVLSDAIHQVKNVIDTRKPMDTLLEKGPKAMQLLQFGPAEGVMEGPPPPLVEGKPPVIQNNPAAADEMTTELRKHGYTVRLTQ
jgi:hypothetical protein